MRLSEKEFDFRVWSEDTKSYVKDYVGDGYPYIVIKKLDFGIEFLATTNKTTDYDYEPVENGEIELWSGLKDINGVPIFEGDIVRDKLGERGVVKFLNGVFYIFVNDYAEAILENYAESIVVIGNIHENPELLK